MILYSRGIRTVNNICPTVWNSFDRSKIYHVEWLGVWNNMSVLKRKGHILVYPLQAVLHTLSTCSNVFFDITSPTCIHHCSTMEQQNPISHIFSADHMYCQQLFTVYNNHMIQHKYGTSLIYELNIYWSNYFFVCFYKIEQIITHNVWYYNMPDVMVYLIVFLFSVFVYESHCIILCVNSNNDVQS